MKSYGSKQAVRIAFAQSHNAVKEDNRPYRWTEVAVFYDPTPEKPGKRWIAVINGCSSYPGETTREEVIQVGTLERALELFREDGLGRAVRLQAREWAETELPRQAPETLTKRSMTLDEYLANEGLSDAVGNEAQVAALRWLYGDDMNRLKIQTLLRRDFFVGESTVRMALNTGRLIKVPLIEALRFIDRDAFRAELEARANG